MHKKSSQILKLEKLDKRIKAYPADSVFKSKYTLDRWCDHQELVRRTIDRLQSNNHNFLLGKLNLTEMKQFNGLWKKYNPKNWNIKDSLSNSILGWLSEVEDLLKNGGPIQAIKLFKDSQRYTDIPSYRNHYDGPGLRECKDAVWKYKETGNWNHWSFRKQIKLKKNWVKPKYYDG
tara:strand:- start:317 stop:844 length:528 start_codon:yes stop_codon:yes gene_type:complete